MNCTIHNSALHLKPQVKLALFPQEPRPHRNQSPGKGRSQGEEQKPCQAPITRNDDI